MSRRNIGMLVALVVLLLVGQWAVLRSFYLQPELASIECRATNAGRALAPEEVRVFVYPSGRPWDLVAEGGVQEALPLPPGRYDVRLLLAASADQQSEWFREVELVEGARVVKEATFSAGELEIASSVTNGPDEQTGGLIVYVFSPDDHDEIITSVRPTADLVLAAGTYDLRAVLSLKSEELGVTWLRGVPVEAGARTTRKVGFHRGRLTVEARNAGEALASEAVALTVFAAGDEQEEVLAWGRVGNPMSLDPGRYDVQLTFELSNDRPSRWLRGLDVVEGETLERSVEFSSGSVRVDAATTGGEALRDFQVYVYYYRVGDHREPVAYTPAGEAALLESGPYDVRVHFFRSHDRPDAWFRNVPVEAGLLATYTATFPSGRLLVRAYDADRNELIGDDVFLYVHDVHVAGQRSRPIAVARTGEELVLTGGKYDLHVEDTRAPGRARWLKGVVVEPGERRELSVTIGATPAEVAPDSR